MKILFVIIIMTLLVCLLQVDEMKQKQTKEVKETYIYDVDAYNLACIDAGKILQKEDKVIAHYSSKMNNLQKKVKNSRKEISDIVVKCQEILSKYNIEKSLYKILCDLDKSLPDEITDLELKEIAAAYMTLTIK